MKKKYKNLDTILLIDDDEATNFFNTALIKTLPIELEVEMVYNAQDGLDYLSGEGKFKDRDPNKNPGIIFLDINMPGMSGWDFLMEYNNLKEERKAEIIIAMLTTSLNPDDKDKAEAIKDIKRFMYKPLTKDQIQNLIDQNFQEI